MAATRRRQGMEEAGRLRLLLTAARCVLAAIRACPADESLPAQHRGILLHTIQSLQLLEGYLEFVDPTVAHSQASSTSGAVLLGAARWQPPAGTAGSSQLLLQSVPTPTPEASLKQESAQTAPPSPEPSACAGEHGLDSGALSVQMEPGSPGPSVGAGESGIEGGALGARTEGPPCKRSRGRSRSPLWLDDEGPPGQQLHDHGPDTPETSLPPPEARARISKWDLPPVPVPTRYCGLFEEPGEAMEVLLGEEVEDAAFSEAVEGGLSEQDGDQRSELEGHGGDDEIEDMPQHLVGLSKKVSCVLRYGGKKGRLKKEMCGEGWMARETLFGALSRQSPHDLEAVLTDRRYETRCAAGRTYHRAARRPRQRDGPGTFQPPAWHNSASSSAAAPGSAQWPQRGRHR